jgi:enoyl-CoA hydratase
VVVVGRALDMILTGRTVESGEALAIGLVGEVVAAGRHVERALEIAEQVAGFPQATMLSDRRSLYEGLGRPLPDGLAIEAAMGREVLEEGALGAERFAGGEGRHGSDSSSGAAT